MQLNLISQSLSFRLAFLEKQFPIYPILGLAGTLVGTIAAIVLIPNNPRNAGALVDSGVAMSLGLAFAPAIAAFQNPKSIVRTENLLALSPIYWLLLDLIQGSYDLVQVNNQDIQYAFIAIGLFISCTWIAALFFPFPLPKYIIRSASYELQPKSIFKLIFIFFSLSIFKFAYPCGFEPFTMFYYLGQNRWNAPWVRGALGGWDSFLDHMAYFGYLLPTLTTLLALRSRKFNLPLILSILMTLTISFFLGHTGSRRIIGVIFGSAIFCWILEQDKLKIRDVVLALASVAILLFSMQFMLEYREVGFQSAFNTQPKEMHYEKLHVDDNFLRLAQVIHLIPDSHPFIYEKQIIFTLIRPIPRVLWPEKPTDPGFNLTEATNSTGMEGWIYGVMARMTSILLIRDVQSSSSVVYSLIAMIIFAGMRSMYDLVLMSYALIAWIAVSLLVLPLRKRAS
jgi:hypothetical protein